MFNLLNDYIPMNIDCINVIMQYVYIDNSVYGDFNHKYKDNLLFKSMEFLVYLETIDDMEKNKYFQGYLRKNSMIQYF